jgi:hypothetical protein
MAADPGKQQLNENKESGPKGTFHDVFSPMHKVITLP